MSCRWSKIAAHFPGRTDNEIKNHWNTKIKKKLKLLGLDPVTHKPIDQNDNNSTKNDEEIEEQKINNLKPNHEEIPPSDQDFQMQESGLDYEQKCGIETLNSSCLFNEIKPCQEIGSNISPIDTMPLDSFCFGMGDSNHMEDSVFQNWITSPLPWDIFSSLEGNNSL